MFDDYKTSPFPDMYEICPIISNKNIRKWQGLKTLPLPFGTLKAKLTVAHKIDLLLH
jgi:hypothetical protein